MDAQAGGRARREARSVRVPDAAVAFGAWAAIAAVLAALRGAAALGVPLGPDPAMWGLSASSLLRGEPAHASPGYPLLVALLSAPGLEPWVVGGWVSLAAAAAVPVAVAALAGRLGAPPGVAVGVALAAGLAPDPLQFAFQLQPDALATLITLGVLAAGLRWQDTPTPRAALVWLVAAATLAIVREHGAIVLAAVLAAVVGRRSPVAAGVVGLLVAAALVAVALTDASPLPERWSAPLRESVLGAGTATPPDYAKELPGPAGAAFRDAWARGERGAVFAALFERLVARSGENLVVLGLGLAGFTVAARRRGGGPWAAATTLAPVLLLLLVWSHRRHTSVLLPVGLVGIAAGLAVARPRALATFAAAGLAAWLGRDVPDTVADLRRAAAAGHERLALAAWMAEQPGAWFLGGQHNEVNLHLRWPRHNPALPPPGTPMPTRWSGADWRTMWVAPRGSMPPPFVEAHAVGGLAVYRLEAAPGAARPCAAVTPVAGPLFTTGPVTGAATPPCEAEVWFGPRPERAAGPWQGQPFVPAEGGR